jgi:hypothetical protein
MDLWDIVDIYEEVSPFSMDPKVLKEYQIRVKKAMPNLAHIKNCKCPAKVWKTLCNIPATKSLSNIFLICRKFFTCKMEEGDFNNGAYTLRFPLAPRHRVPCSQILARTMNKPPLSDNALITNIHGLIY